MGVAREQRVGYNIATTKIKEISGAGTARQPHREEMLMNGMHHRPPAGERLHDLLDDPIAETLMRRDGVTRDDVLAVVADMRVRLFGCANGRFGPLAHAGKPIRLAA